MVAVAVTCRGCCVQRCGRAAAAAAAPSARTQAAALDRAVASRLLAETHARDDARRSDASDEEDAREAAGTSSSVIAARRAWRDEVRARLADLSASSGVPLSGPGRDPARDASEAHAGGRGHGKKQTDGRESDAAENDARVTSPESALERAAFTASLPHVAGHAYDHFDLLRAVASASFADEDADARDARTENERRRKHIRGVGVQQVVARGFPWLRAARSCDCSCASSRPIGARRAWTRRGMRRLRRAEPPSPAEAASRRENVRNDEASEACLCGFLRGAPAALRGGLWRLALGARGAGAGGAGAARDGGIEFDVAREDFDRACSEARETRLLTDALCASDARAFCDHPHFFPFEETLRAVAVAFSRDRDVPASCARAGERPPHPRVYGVHGVDTRYVRENVAGAEPRRIRERRKKEKNERLSLYPPSGFVPFKGLARLIAPLCYLYPHPAEIHGVFKALYARLFRKLHALDDDAFPRPAFPGLLAAFEDALFAAEPDLCFHLAEIGCPAARLATPWLFGAIAGYLSVEQTLLLWDRVIGLGARPARARGGGDRGSKPALLAATCEEEARESLEDLSAVKVAPLLQAFVFRDDDDEAAFASGEETGAAFGSDEDEDEYESDAFDSEAADDVDV